MQLPASGRIAHFSAIVAGEIVGHGFSALPSGAPPGRPLCRLCEALVALHLQEFQEFADLVAVLGGVAHADVGVDAVVVATADPFAVDVAGFPQLGDDALGGPLSDPNALGDVTEPGVRVSVDAEKDLGVVREEPPRLAVFFSP